MRLFTMLMLIFNPIMGIVIIGSIIENFYWYLVIPGAILFVYLNMKMFYYWHPEDKPKPDRWVSETDLGHW